MSRSAAQDALRRLPAMDRLLAEPAVAELVSLYGREPVRVQARRALEGLREELAAGRLPADRLGAEVTALPARIAAGLEGELGTPLRRALNATGVFLHTNLGRAPLPRDVASALPLLLDAYCDLEIDLVTGRRGDRNRRAGALVAALTGAERALVTNNNAAALVLVLATFASGRHGGRPLQALGGRHGGRPLQALGGRHGGGAAPPPPPVGRHGGRPLHEAEGVAERREVVVSRGELVEIGGSFRIPDILRAAGAELREVGTTNRTRLEDYEGAIGPRTAMLLKVFPSNYRVSGFVESVPAARLAALASEHGLPFLVDEGSGLLRPSEAPQLAGHESLSELLAAGCPLVCGSGDKLLGGPQAGLLLGRAELVAACKENPLYRALRPDRAALAALEGVLRLHLRGGELPLDRMWPEPADHRGRLERTALAIGADVVPAEGFLGGGAAPERPLPGEALALPGDDALLARLRGGDPPVVGYIKEGRLILDLRTVDPADDEALVEAVRRARAGAEGR